MPATPRQSRSVEYVAFAEVVHGRWVKIELDAPSPQAALEQVRQMKFGGQVIVARKSQTMQFQQKGNE